jgi:zinc protease
MKKVIFAVLGLITLYSNMNAQAKLVEKSEPDENSQGIYIPYTKYVLPNGLTLVVSEDHSDPIVHVDVTYHVGSAREEIGMSGFAHFFEHMMFQGSKNVADEEHFKIVTQAGGTMNGTTNRDRTNYFETVPRNYLETALWLEADRMGFLLDAVTQPKFEIQRATVKNEKGQNYENRPYGMVGIETSKSLYPFGHPYSWPTIGYIEDLNRVGVDDLKKFFLRWYGPNNAVLTIGGDVNTDDVVKLVEKYFGSIPAGPAVEKVLPEKITLNDDRYISIEDNVRFPMLNLTFPSAPMFSKDEAALDILAEILGQGKTSILYQNFIKTRKAVQAYAYNPASELSGEFTISILSMPGNNLADMEKLVRQSLEELEKRGITDDDLQKAKAKHIADAIYSLESVSGKTSQLAAYQTFLGDPGYIYKDVQRYSTLTKEDILRVFNQYIKGKHAVVVSVYPKGKKDIIAAPDNYIAGGDTSNVKHKEDYSGLTYKSATDNFNRAKHPKPGASPVVDIPTMDQLKTDRGTRVYYVHNNEVPDVYLQINIKGGKIFQPDGKQGISYMLAKMLQESTMMHTAEEITNMIDKYGSRIYIYSDDENIVVQVQALKQYFGPTMEIVNEMLMSPKFDRQDFERLQQQQLESIQNQSVQASAVASAAFNKLIYGNEIVSEPSYGTMESVKNLTLEDVRRYYNELISPEKVTVMASGQVDKNFMLDFIKHMFSTRPPKPENMPQLTNAPKFEKTKIYLVNKDNAPQSEIRVGYLALPYDADGNFYKATVMNYILGGAFNSRINLNLREDKGWTYGARSYFSGSHFKGPFVVSTGVRADVTDSAVFEIMKELKNYRENGITKDELNFTKKSILERDALRYETNPQKAGFAEMIAEYNLPTNYKKVQANILKKLKVKDINKLAKDFLPLDNMVIVVVGDAKLHRAALEKLGYEVVDYKPFEYADISH